MIKASVPTVIPKPAALFCTVLSVLHAMIAMSDRRETFGFLRQKTKDRINPIIQTAITESWLRRLTRNVDKVFIVQASYIL